jgi:hypothetical protein
VKLHLWQSIRALDGKHPSDQVDGVTMLWQRGVLTKEECIQVLNHLADNRQSDAQKEPDAP